MNVFRLILRNTRRHPLRTSLTIIVMAIAVMGFVLIRTFIAAWYAGAAEASPNRLVTTNSISIIFPMPLAYERKILDVPGVTGVSCGQWFGGIYIDPKNFFPRFAVDHKTYFDLYPEYEIPPDQKEVFMRERNAAIVGKKLADRYGWKLGDQIRIQGDIFPGDWDFVIRAFFTTSKESTGESVMYFHFDYLDERMRAESPERAGQVGSFIVRIDDPNNAAAISERIDAIFKNSAAETKTQTEEAFGLSFVQMSSSIILGLQAVSYMVIGIILLVLANTMAMTARERISEYAILKTLGFSALHIIGLVFGESLVIACLGGIGGLLLTVPIVSLVKAALVDFFPVFPLEPLTYVLAFAAALFVGITAAIFPVMKALRTSIVDGLRVVD